MSKFDAYDIIESSGVNEGAVQQAASDKLKEDITNEQVAAMEIDKQKIIETHADKETKQAMAVEDVNQLDRDQKLLKLDQVADVSLANMDFSSSEDRHTFGSDYRVSEVAASNLLKEAIDEQKDNSGNENSLAKSTMWSALKANAPLGIGAMAVDATMGAIDLAKNPEQIEVTDNRWNPLNVGKAALKIALTDRKDGKSFIDEAPKLIANNLSNDLMNIASSGYSGLYHLIHGIAGIEDFATSWARPDDAVPFTKMVEDSFSTIMESDIVSKPDDKTGSKAFLKSIQDKAGVTEQFKQSGLTDEEIESNVQSADIAGKFIGTGVLLGNGMRAFNAAVGVQSSGLLGNVTAGTAYKQASLLSQIGVRPVGAIAKDLGISAIKAFSVGAGRTLTAEGVLIASEFEKDYASTWNTYSAYYTDSPKLSYGLLLAGGALDVYGLKSAHRSLWKDLDNQALAVTSSKIGSATELLGHGQSITNNRLAIIEGTEYSAKYTKVAQDTKEQLSKAFAEGNLTKEVYSDAIEQINNRAKEIDSTYNETLNKVTRNPKEKAIIKNLATENPYILASTTKIQSYKNALSQFEPTKEKTLGAVTKSLWNKKAEAALNEKGFSRFVVNSDGTMIPVNKYKPSIWDTLSPRDITKNGKSGLVEISRDYKKGKDIINIFNAPTFDTAAEYSALVKLNGEKIALGASGYDKGLKVSRKVKDKNTGAVIGTKEVNKPLNDMTSLIKSMDEQAVSNPWVANSLAQLITDYPQIARNNLLYSPTEYRRMAGKVSKEALKAQIRAGKDLVEEAAKLNLQVVDNDRAIVSLYSNNNDLTRKGSGFIAGDMNKTSVEASDKLVVTVDNSIVEKIRIADSLEDYSKTVAADFQKQVVALGDEHPILKPISTLFDSNSDLVAQAKNVDAIGPSILPAPVSHLTSRMFNALGDTTMSAVNRLADIATTSAYRNLSERLRPLKDMSGKLGQADSIALNKFKDIVNAGADIVDDGVALRLSTKEIKDAAGDVIGYELTNRNKNAVARLKANGAINETQYQALTSGEELIYLPDARGVGEQLELSNGALEYLREYRTVNDEMYNARRNISALYDADKNGYTQPFHMNKRMGEHVEFVYNGEELVSTISGDTVQQLANARKKELQILNDLYPDTDFTTKTLAQNRREHLSDPNTDWLGWNSGVIKSDNLPYQSGRQDRTTVTAAFDFNPELVNDLYNDLITSGKGLAQNYMGAFFNKEAQYAGILADGATDPAMRTRYQEYAALLNGRSIQTSTGVNNFNKWIDKAFDRPFDKLTNVMDDWANSNIREALVSNKELKAMDDFIVKLPKLRGSDVTRQIQEFTNWSMLRFGKMSYAVMNMLSLVPMSKLAIDNTKKSVRELDSSYRARTGLYGTLIDGAEGYSTPDWLGSFVGTTRRMFTKENGEMLERAAKGGYISTDAPLLRDIVFDSPKVFSNKESKSAAMKLIKSTANNINKGMTFIGDESEKLSRTFSFSMGEHVARKMGIQEESARFIFAKQFSDNVVANYSALNKPSIYRGAVPALLGTFKTYKLNVMQQLLDTYGREGAKGLVGAFGVQALTFGGNSLPYSTVIQDAILPPTGEDDGYGKIYKLTGGNEGLTRAIMYGVPSAAIDMDVSSRGEIDPVTGGFLPVNGSLKPTDLVPVARSVTDTIDLAKSVFSELRTKTGMSASRLNELIGQKAPINFVKTMSKAFNRLDDVYGDGEKYNYKVNRDGTINKTSLAATLLDFRGLEETRTYDINRRQLARDTIKGEQMETVRQACRGAVRRLVSGEAVIDQDTYKNCMEDYLKAGGEQLGFNQFFTNQVNSGTFDKTANQILLKSKSKTPTEYTDMMKLMKATSFEKAE